MQNAAIASFMLLFLFLPPSILAQQPGVEVPIVTPGPGWKTCPRCENGPHIADDRKKAGVDARPFDSHDLSGVWGNNGIPLDTKMLPPLTPEGQKLYEALMKQVGQEAGHIDPLNDPLTNCDPEGTVRAFGYNYGIEFVQTPSRVFEFIEWSHTWRTIWIDGRKLPDDPPVARWLGYNVGRWDGDTFVVESNGYDTRALVGSEGDHPLFPHSADMKVVENYKRLDYGKLQASITIIDAKIFTKPWTTTGTIELLPNAEIGEYFCAPSETMKFQGTLPTRALARSLKPDPESGQTRSLEHRNSTFRLMRVNQSPFEVAYAITSRTCEEFGQSGDIKM